MFEIGTRRCDQVLAVHDDRHQSLLRRLPGPQVSPTGEFVNTDPPEPLRVPAVVGCGGQDRIGQDQPRGFTTEGTGEIALDCPAMLDRKRRQ